MVYETNQPEHPSFLNYLFKIPANKKIIIFSLIAAFVQFSAFKYYYPYASYIHGDSFVYIESAYNNESISTYMVGYSMFLRLLSVFSTSDTILTSIQYFLIEGTSLFLLFTIFYFYRIGKIIRLFLIVFAVINPLFLILANMVSSDPYFYALSMIWVTLLVWILNRPRFKIAVWHAIILFIAFTVRYNSLIYIPISIVCFMFSVWANWKKIVSLAFAAILIGLFVLNTGTKYKQLTGHWQYSPFSGWQMANNAMYAYRYVDSADRKDVPTRFQNLDLRIRQYFDRTRDTKKFIFETLMANTLYMWSPPTPLYTYRNSLFKKDSSATEFKKWASMGPLYNEYGWYIIRKYPGYFARYFLWPNANKYFAPPLEFLGTYNSGHNTVDSTTMKWFRYNTTIVKTRTHSISYSILGYYPILSGALNMVMLLSLIFYFSIAGFKSSGRIHKWIFLSSSIWILNAMFTIFASSAALRFQTFPIILTMISNAILIDWMITAIGATSKETTSQELKNSIINYNK